MVYVKLSGRIGNHLFQIATAASLADNNDCEFAVICNEDMLLAEPDNCTIYEYVQQYKNSIFKGIKILIEVPANCQHYREEDALYKPIKFTRNIFLHGPFQSEKYFNSNLIRELFLIPPDLKASLKKRYGEILSMEPTSINVRRGDYLKRPHEYNITTINFFRKAINYIGNKKNYLIISDDIKWCKKNFKGSNFFFADNNEPIEDLYLQSLCKNNIISNSTFSWWGAWLNVNSQKIVVAPKPWYGKSFSNIKTDDLIPTQWIQLENRMPLALQILSLRIRTKDFFRTIYHSQIKKYFR